MNLMNTELFLTELSGLGSKFRQQNATVKRLGGKPRVQLWPGRNYALQVTNPTPSEDVQLCRAPRSRGNTPRHTRVQIGQGTARQSLRTPREVPLRPRPAPALWPHGTESLGKPFQNLEGRPAASEEKALAAKGRGAGFLLRSLGLSPRGGELNMSPGREYSKKERKKKKPRIAPPPRTPVLRSSLNTQSVSFGLSCPPGNTPHPGVP